MRVVVFRLLEAAVFFDAVEAARPVLPAGFRAVEPLRLAVDRDDVRDVPDVERARDVPERDVVAFARDAVDFARVPVADFAREAVVFALDFARDVVALAREVVGFARAVVDFARDVPDVERARDVPDPDRERDVVPPEERFAAVVRPPLLPAAFFCAAERLEVERDELREVVEPERDRLDEADPERDRLVPLDLLDLLDLRGVAARTREMVSSLCGCCGCSPSLASSSGCGE